MGITTTDKDLGEKEILRQVGKLDDSFVEIGFIKGDKGDEDHDGLTNIKLAQIHEFGFPPKNIPERSFIRATHDRELKKINTFKAKLVTKVLSLKMTSKKALATLGEFVLQRNRNTLRQSIGIKDLKASTIAARLREFSGKRNAGGSPKPLLSTGQMSAAMTTRVVEK